MVYKEKTRMSSTLTYQVTNRIQTIDELGSDDHVEGVRAGILANEHEIALIKLRHEHAMEIATQNHDSSMNMMGLIMNWATGLFSLTLKLIMGGRPSFSPKVADDEYDGDDSDDDNEEDVGDAEEKVDSEELEVVS
jgi:hypothetical protein